MSNIAAKLNDMNIVASTLTDKKQQTDYKIKYVSEYVNQWAIISSERDEIADITFIDCMCNAGVYQDGDLWKYYSFLTTLLQLILPKLIIFI